MNTQLQIRCNGSGDFNPVEFLRLVIGAGDDDHVGIVIGSAFSLYCPQLHEVKDEVLYGSRMLESNCWFCGSVLDGKGQRKKDNCLFTKSIVLETDYGTEGHKKPSPFPDYQSALAHINAQKVRPQILWWSGHGFQMAFLLDEIVRFSDAASTADYENLKSCLYEIFCGDTTMSREHLFRMPCSMNRKPGCKHVKGEILRWEVTP